MSVDDRLEELLLRWEELHEQGRPVTPEKLCADCPELLDELRRRIQILQALNPVLDPEARRLTAVEPSPSGGTLSPGAANWHIGAAVPGYEILGELGRGGMGVVYKARQKSLDRIVALKMVLAGAHAGKEQLARFRYEAEAAAHLQHPNIVQVYEIGEQDRCPYFSLEYVDGQCLDDIVYACPQPPLKAAALVEQLARAVHYAHQRNIIHRDLKPGNILLTEDGTPKITDFGLAKRLDDDQARTRTGDVMGTPSYMAPEQAAGKIKEIGPGTDIYSLGAILYEMLTGTPPFDGVTSWDTINMVLSAEPVPPTQRNTRVPRDLETICLKCLEKEPAKRYASAAALADDLHRYLDGEPILARPVGWIERGVKWARRRPAVASLLALSASALLALLIGGWMAYGNAIKDKQALEEAQEEVIAATTAKHQADVQALVRLNVINGTHYLEDGDLFGSLIWFARALKGDGEANSERRETHQMRIAAVLRQCPRLSQFWTHAESVTDVEFSPDGQWVVTASDDNTARVWNAVTGELRFPMPLRHSYHIYRATFSPDGHRIVTASGDKTAKVWDAATGQDLQTLEGHTKSVNDARFSPDGRRVVTASDDDTARVWDAAAGKTLHILKGHTRSVVCASFSWDGKRILTASEDHTACLWLTKTGELLHTLKGHTQPLTDACFSHDGTQVATASEDERAQVWNARTGERVGDWLQHHGAVLHVVFSPDDAHVATASADLAARIWDVATSMRIIPALRHRSLVGCVMFSRDGSKVVTASDDNTCRVWDSETGRPLTPPVAHNGTVSRACFAPDGQRIATAAEDTTARVYDLVPERPALQHQEAVNQASFSPDGQRIVTASRDTTARVWEAETSQCLWVLRGHEGSVVGAEFSPDGRRIVTASYDHDAIIWGAGSGERLITLRGHDGPVNTARFSPNGQRVVTSSDDNSARIWNAETGETVFVLVGQEGHQEEFIRDAVFSPDGSRVATASSNRTARLWDAATGRPLGKPMHHQRRVVRVAFSPDGRRLVTASYDRTAQLWDAWSGDHLQTYQQAGPVRDACFSPDGRRVGTGSDDNTGRIWSAIPIEQPPPLLPPPLWHWGAVDTIRFSSGGGRVATASADNTGRVWDTVTGQPLTPALQHRDWGKITDIDFSPDGKLVVTASEDGTAQVWDLTGAEWAPEPLEKLAMLLGGNRIGPDDASLVPLTAAQLKSLWTELRTTYLAKSKRKH
jgi:WD40 repeat protein/tRNA A-37 threonylcarbamoyl transferase component Bud32